MAARSHETGVFPRAQGKHHQAIPICRGQTPEPPRPAFSPTPSTLLFVRRVAGVVNCQCGLRVVGLHSNLRHPSRKAFQEVDVMQPIDTSSQDRFGPVDLLRRRQRAAESSLRCDGPSRRLNPPLADHFPSSVQAIRRDGSETVSGQNECLGESVRPEKAGTEAAADAVALQHVVIPSGAFVIVRLRFREAGAIGGTLSV
jgi:hypothetical protein